MTGISTTAATPAGNCWRCGGQLYEYLVHSCTTSAAIPVPGRPDTTDPLDLDALIEWCESTAGVLSMEPTAFQLEQAVNFLVATVPSALRRMKDDREALVAVARAARELVLAEYQFTSPYAYVPIEDIQEIRQALARLDGAR